MKNNETVALDAIQVLITDAEGVTNFRWSQYYKEMGRGATTLELDDIKERIVLWNQVISLMRNLAKGVVPTLTPDKLFLIRNELSREVRHRKHMSNVYRQKMRFDAAQWTSEFNKFIEFRDRGVKMQELIEKYYSKQTLFG
jgi:hypothetical protein